ncbi:N-acyl homoserine lactonase [Photorhabdus sp. P32]|uniref:N-acyl homoserine lactonase n=1 Tax=Photorhabdus sp. P32 TaxID=3117549 RepID=UPI00311ABD7F
MKKPIVGLLLSIVFFSANTLAFTQAENETEVQNNIANRLTQQYNNTVKDCGDAQSPAFLCSGVILRGTIRSNNHKFWQPSSSSIKSGGVSFSYLRKDAKFKRLAYGYKNGFIVFPEHIAPKDSVDFSVLCAFPIDGYTNERANKGCGENITKAKDKGKSCQEQNVMNSDDWIKNYRKVNSQDLFQCGFNVTKDVDNPAIAFYQMLESIKKLPRTPNIPPKQNEIRISTWEENDPSKLPIEALFYSENSGLADAQKDQRDYKDATGKFLPIVKMLLPRTLTEDALFKFKIEDQVIKP